MQFLMYLPLIIGLIGLITKADADHDGKLSGEEKLNLVVNSGCMLANQFGIQISTKDLTDVVNALVAVFNNLAKPKK